MRECGDILKMVLIVSTDNQFKLEYTRNLIHKNKIERKELHI